MHKTVLLEQAVECWVHDPRGSYVDATFGRGGHTGLALEYLHADGRIIALDRDPAAIKAGASINDSRLSLQHAAFSELSMVLERAGCPRVDGILFDLGVSSPQLDEAERGFSFRNDGPLDMRMNNEAGPSAAEYLATVAPGELQRVLKEYGEERFARRIAQAIVRRREESPFTTTLDLAATIAAAIPRHDRNKHPATRSFQAIRIAVNQEMDELHTALEQTVNCLRPRGTLVVISFHSLEDRMVKQFMRRRSTLERVSRRLPPDPNQQPAPLQIVGRFRPTDAEVDENPRARSAVMRVARRVG